MTAVAWSAEASRPGHAGQSFSPSAGRVNKYLSRKAWESRIQAPEKDTAVGQEDLDALIQKLKAVRIQPRKPVDAPDESTDTGADANSPVESETPPIAPPPEPNTVTLPEPTVKTGPLSSETLAEVDRISLAALSIEQSLQVADLLYDTNYRDRAEPFYRQVVDGMDPNAPLYEEHRSWALFQLGNCLRPQEPGQAMLVYQRLIADHPEAPWRTMAETWSKLADLYWREQPLQILNPETSSVSPAANLIQSNGDTSL